MAEDKGRVFLASSSTFVRRFHCALLGQFQNSSLLWILRLNVLRCLVTEGESVMIMAWLAFREVALAIPKPIRHLVL